MTNILRITPQQVSQLNSIQLVDLLRRLLHAEAHRHKIARRGILVPAQITVPDQGEDGRIEWSNGPQETDYLPSRLCMFQSKATTMPKGKCKSEVKQKDGALKPAIQAVLESGGAYIIFCRDKCRGHMLTERRKGIMEGIKEATRNQFRTPIIDFYDANKISDWVNTYPSVATRVNEQLTDQSFSGFQSWESWSENSELGVSQYKFVTGDVERDPIIDFPEHLSQPRRVARIIGQAGLGKTRLALEMFRPPTGNDNPAAKAQSENILYIKSEFGSSRILEHIAAFRDKDAEVLVIVDDCESGLHQKLAKIIRHANSRMSLLTLDYDPEGTAGETHVCLNPVGDNVIKEILLQAYQGLSANDIDRIAFFAQGYPGMAVLLGDARLENASDISTLEDDVLLKKMLWGREQEDQQGRDVIATCALFNVLGVEGRVKDQMEFAADLFRIQPAEFYTWIQKFYRRKLIQRRGDFIQVLPKPIALWLAAKKWQEIRPDDARQLFLNEKMPNGMSEALCDQLSKLDTLGKAREIVEELCGQGPFGQAEALNTERGSRCFRSMVETNPEATVNALVREFGGWTTDQLMKVGPGRRNLIWSLEKLCFRRSTFPMAARLLLSFAVAENEPWGNNATGQFVSLFQMKLSGTEALPEEKFSILDEALASGDKERENLALKALGRGLQTGHFSRRGGAESQGSGSPLVDWFPKTIGEQRNYLENCLTRLVKFACRTDELGNEARSKISSHLHGLICMGLIDEIKEALDQIISVHGSYWPEAMEGIAHALRYEGPKMPKDYKAKVQGVFDSLLPTALADRLKFFITELPWTFFDHDEDTSSMDRAAEKAQKLAEEVALDKKILFEQLPALLRGEQREFYPFGKRLGEIFDTPQEFIDQAIAILQSHSDKTSNPSLLGAFLAGLEPINRTLVDATLDRVADSDDLRRYLVQLTRLIRISPSDLVRIIVALQKGFLDENEIRALSYGSVLSHLQPIEVEPLIQALIDRGNNALWVALHISAMYVHGNQDHFDALKPQIKRLVMEPNLLLVKEGPNLDLHHFETLAICVLKSENENPDVAVHLTQEILKLCQKQRFPHHLDHLISAFIPELLKQYPKPVWKLISDAILTSDGLTSIHLERFLGKESFDEKKDVKGPLFILTDSTLLQWCRENSPKAPVFIARIAPLLTPSGRGGKKWTSLVQKLIDEFGNCKKVLGSLESNMLSFGSWGSRVPYYERYIEPLKSLQTHRHSLVRKFAQDMLRQLNNFIKDEHRRDEERDLGIY